MPIKIMNITGTILGYDPGGNSSHGLSVVTLNNDEISRIENLTLKTAENVINIAHDIPDLIAVGVDTLSCWCTGHGGWRPADRWLKAKYKNITRSIVSPNSLYGSMGLNGMSVLISLRELYPNLSVTETHPKVLYMALTGHKYDYDTSNKKMDSFLSSVMGHNITTTNDHEWDAAISVYAAHQGLAKKWKRDLHSLSLEQAERLIKPCGNTVYWWPD